MAGMRSELEHLYMDEELFWRQRCKNQWAKEGDRNTSVGGIIPSRVSIIQQENGKNKGKRWRGSSWSISAPYLRRPTQTQ